jgi:hypothetical protein
MLRRLRRALVGIAEYYSYTHGFKPLALGHVKMGAMGFEYARRTHHHRQSHRVRKSRALCRASHLVYRGQNIFSMTRCWRRRPVYLSDLCPTAVIPFYVMLGLAFLLGFCWCCPSARQTCRW